jgi:hypothetical protein
MSGPRPIGQVVRLITNQMAEAAFLRRCLEADAEHAVAAVIHRRYSVRDALHFLITTALNRGERAKMTPEASRAVARALFWDRLWEEEERVTRLRFTIADAIKSALADDPGNFEAAAAAGASVARECQAPVHILRTALRSAMGGA